MRNNVFACQVRSGSMIQTAQSDCKFKKYKILIIKMFIFNNGYVNIRNPRDNSYHFQYILHK